MLNKLQIKFCTSQGNLIDVKMNKVKVITKSNYDIFCRYRAPEPGKERYRSGKQWFDYVADRYEIPLLSSVTTQSPPIVDADQALLAVLNETGFGLTPTPAAPAAPAAPAQDPLTNGILGASSSSSSRGNKRTNNFSSRLEAVLQINPDPELEEFMKDLY